MSGLVPDTPVFLAYTAAALILLVTPGPDLTLFVSRTLAGGRAAGMASVAGVAVGLLVHSAFAAIGLSALLAASPQAFAVVKVAGALYLLYLAVEAIRTGSAARFETAGQKGTLGRVFLTGLWINLINPKIVLFFVTFLPQFVDPGDPDAAGRLAFLGLWYVALSIPVCGGIVLAAERLARTLRGNPAALRVFDWLTAGLFGTFALRLVLSRNG